MNFNLDRYQSAWKNIQKSKVLNCQSNLVDPVYLSVFDAIPSTNTLLWQLIDSGIKLPAAAIALQQTAGKGQWGHRWISPQGGLYLSVGLDLDLEIDKYPHLVIATAWGIATILRSYRLPITIKWSNDLILEQRKLGGIKIETRNKYSKLIKAVIGVGINWHNSVPNPGINLESYYQKRDLKQINSLEELTAITTYGILLGYEYYLAVGIEKLLDKYLAILNSLGKQINFNGSSGEVIGVTPEGKLKVKLRSPGANTTILLSPGQISLGYQ
ncbi:MAG: biotin--[acetyl-CoA-carboxylase] ligase [Cyanobacteria bacterium P01_G01_bin.39]